MTELIYTRKGNTIEGNGETQRFSSIAAAKRASRKLQLATDGALGLGSLKVLERAGGRK